MYVITYYNIYICMLLQSYHLAERYANQFAYTESLEEAYRHQISYLLVERLRKFFRGGGRKKKARKKENIKFNIHCFLAKEKVV